MTFEHNLNWSLAFIGSCILYELSLCIMSLDLLFDPNMADFVSICWKGKNEWNCYFSMLVPFLDNCYIGCSLDKCGLFIFTWFLAIPSLIKVMAYLIPALF